MRTWTLVRALVALLLSLLAGAIAFRWIEGEKAALGSVPVEVAVAASSLPRGTRLTPAHVRVAPVEGSALPPGHFTDPGQLDGRLVTAPIASGEPIDASRVSADGIGVLVRPGRRALAVRGSRVHGLGGTVSPGASVDVLFTSGEAGGKYGGKEGATRIVLEGVQVIAVEKDPGHDQQGRGTEEKNPLVYVLELAPAEAEKLALASTMGTLHFALRNPGDVSTVLTQGVGLEAMLPAAREPAARPRPGKVAAEVIRGVDRTRADQPAADSLGRWRRPSS